MLDAVSNDKKIVIEWGFFGLIEFLISESRNIQKNIKVHWILEALMETIQKL